jgi:hypothetical protein
MGRQFGDHTEISKEIAIERENAAKAKAKNERTLNMVLLAVFLFIGVFSVGKNILGKSGYKEEAVKISATYDEKKAELDDVIQKQTEHKELMEKHIVDNNTVDVSYEEAQKIFKDDIFIENISAIKNNSLTDMYANICKLQNDISDMAYKGYVAENPNVSKEQGDMMLKLDGYFVDGAKTIWSDDMFKAYISAHKNDKNILVNVPENNPFEWQCSVNYSYSVVTNNMGVTWKCVDKKQPDIVYAFAVSLYDSKLNKFNEMKFYYTSYWDDLLISVTPPPVDDKATTSTTTTSPTDATKSVVESVTNNSQAQDN